MKQTTKFAVVLTVPLIAAASAPASAKICRPTIIITGPIVVTTHYRARGSAHSKAVGRWVTSAKLRHGRNFSSWLAAEHRQVRCGVRRLSPDRWEHRCKASAQPCLRSG